MKLRQIILLIAILLIVSPNYSAEQLPIKTYTIAEGLARDSIGCIVQDSHGFMWFCTPDGLSRFDGYGFANYGPEQGLPNRPVTGLVETRDGLYWLGAGDGLYLFNPRGSGQ
jgi:ligand-binding sensor domain-containing protein